MNLAQVGMGGGEIFLARFMAFFAVLLFFGGLAFLLLLVFERRIRRWLGGDHP